MCDYAVAPIARQVTLDGREGGRERERELVDVFIGPVCDYAVAPIARQVTLDGREGGSERERELVDGFTGQCVTTPWRP